MGRPSAEGASRIEAPQAPRGGLWGKGVPILTGKGAWGEGSTPSQNFFSNFSLQIATFGALWGLFYGSVDCFGGRQPLHDCIMSVTGVIAGS